MAFSLDQAMQGFGVGLHQVGTENMRAAIMAERDQNLARLQAERDARQNQFTEQRDINVAKLGRETHAANAQTDIANIPARSEAETTALVGREEALRPGKLKTKTGEYEAMTPLEAARQRQVTGATIEAQLDAAPRVSAAEADRTRTVGRAKNEVEAQSPGHALDKERLGLERSRVGIQRAELGLRVKQHELAYEKGQIEIGQLRKVQNLQSKYEAAKTPEEKDAIADQIDVLTGKGGKYKPIMSKDELGNTTYQGAFDERRGEMRTSSPAAKDPLGLGPLLRKPTDKPTDKPAAKPGVIAGAQVSAPVDAVEAQLNFDHDAKTLSPAQLVSLYEPFASQLKPEQLRKLDVVKSQIPRRALPFGR